MNRAPIKKYLRDLEQTPNVSSWETFIAHLDSPSMDDVFMTDTSLEDQSEVELMP